MTDSERDTARLTREAVRTTGRTTSPWVRAAQGARLPHKVHTDASRSFESVGDILRRTLPRGEA